MDQQSYALMVLNIGTGITYGTAKVANLLSHMLMVAKSIGLMASVNQIRMISN
jgi:protein-L-isoaspartate O-methyltransferase